jgi:hypothetical protein
MAEVRQCISQQQSLGKAAVCRVNWLGHSQPEPGADPPAASPRGRAARGSRAAWPRCRVAGGCRPRRRAPPPERSPAGRGAPTSATGQASQLQRNQQNRRRQSWRPACACPPHPPAGERESRDHGQDTRSVKIGVRPTGRNLSTILTEPGAADVFTVKDIAQREGLEQVCIRTVQREGDPCGERLMRPDLAAECDVPCNLVSDGRCVVDLALVKVPGCL